jgi:hypothetical protein
MEQVSAQGWFSGNRGSDLLGTPLARDHPDHGRKQVALSLLDAGAPVPLVCQALADNRWQMLGVLVDFHERMRLVVGIRGDQEQVGFEPVGRPCRTDPATPAVGFGLDRENLVSAGSRAVARRIAAGSGLR